MIELILIPPIVANAYYWYCIDPGQVFDFIPKIFQNSHPKIRKITYECVICITGQLSLWSNVFYYWPDFTVRNVSEIVVSVSLAMIMADFVSYLIQKLRQ